MKTIFFVLLCACCLAACSSLNNNEQEQNVAIVKSMFNAFNKHDWKAMADHYADSASFLDPAYGTEYVVQSKAEMIQKYSELQAMFPDVQDHVVGLYPSGDKVAVEFISSGKNDSVEFTLPISCILTLKDGKIIRDATYYDL